ncbi:hypothetical protein [Proteiniborus sp. MB09-C3]|uniref:hypothetical protein n=1 Tax=Proteiniborus sp. MB09-C3 TaxID=3050072 RepID=UPI002554D63A|nr:hypothetical protein [Proteiniborus sp. MB09-C3]WIV13457.1 hypothetical protein QO263_07050 [Proteiniborus sp. MB09-C3]
MWQKIKKNYILIVLTLLIAVIIVDTSSISFGEPGDSEDPLVTFSFVEKRIEQLKYYIDEKLSGGSTDNTEVQRLLQENEAIKKQLSQLAANSSGSASLEIVELRDGQKLICGAGTEIILRSGSAKAIVSELGGLSDLTGGKDLAGNESISLNHLIIIPRDDGRGAYVEKYAIFMIRGYYEVK